MSDAPKITPVTELLMKASAERTTEVLKSLTTLSTETCRAALLMNGGAVVALLAFAGTAPALFRLDVARNLSVPIELYALGVFFATAALGVAYTMQLRYFNYRTAVESVWTVKEERPLTAAEEKTIDEKASKPPHRLPLVLAQVVGVLSLIFFLLGTLGAVSALGTPMIGRY